MKRDLHRWKKVCRKMPIYVEKDRCMRKKTHVCGKRPVQESSTCEKRPIKETHLTIHVCKDLYISQKSNECEKDQ